MYSRYILVFPIAGCILSLDVANALPTAEDLDAADADLSPLHTLQGIAEQSNGTEQSYGCSADIDCPYGNKCNYGECYECNEDVFQTPYCETLKAQGDCTRNETAELMALQCYKTCGYCDPLHCVWGDWVNGTCSAECDWGTQNNTRVKDIEEANGGWCSGEPTETVMCKEKECPVHCEWDDWIIGECSLTCGGGTRTNTRTEKVEAKHEGEACKGPATITESCNVELCPGCRGGDSCCTTANQCDVDEGDCDNDDDCKAGLLCGTDCPTKTGFQWDANDDCCFKPPTIVCEALDSAFDCANEGGGIRVNGTTGQECAATCVEKARGQPGCCEWQTDWKVCIYVPGGATKDHANADRLAINCEVVG